MEKPFTGDLIEYAETGHYDCSICSTTLFESEHKISDTEGYAAFWTSNKDVMDYIKPREVTLNHRNLIDPNILEYSNILTGLKCKCCGSFVGVIKE